MLDARHVTEVFDLSNEGKTLTQLTLETTAVALGKLSGQQTVSPPAVVGAELFHRASESLCHKRLRDGEAVSTRLTVFTPLFVQALLEKRLTSLAAEEAVSVIDPLDDFDNPFILTLFALSKDVIDLLELLRTGQAAHETHFILFLDDFG